MRIKHFFIPALVILIGSIESMAAPTIMMQPPRGSRATRPNSPQRKTATPVPATFATDIANRLAKYRPVTMFFDNSRLTSDERLMVARLVEACRYLEGIFWLQSDPEALVLYQSLAGSKKPEDINLRHLLMINASRFDLIDDNAPFAVTDTRPPGRGLYPKGLTRSAIEQYVASHPQKKAEIYSPYTVIRRRGSELEGLPYHIAYRNFLEPAAKALRGAAIFSTDSQFAKFLRLRADALLTDDYYPSDLAWLDLEDPKFDLIFAPYETYLDGLLGVKTSYGAAVLIRNEEESKKLAVFQKFVPEIQDALPLPPEDRPSKQGQRSPMEVMDSPFRAGDLRHGYQAVADNLPNDARIHEARGTKKIFFKNFMDARVNFIILPIANILMEPAQASRASGEGYLADVMMHEISHGLGPAYARTAAGKVSIREAIGPAFSGLEEAKADVVGMFALKWLVDQGALPRNRLPEYYDSYVAGIFRTVRFGAAEAHGRAETMEFNFLSEQGALNRNPSTQRYEIAYDRMPQAIEKLAAELLTMEATGDRARVESWFKKYGSIGQELKSSLELVRSVPVDIDPKFSFEDRVQ